MTLDWTKLGQALRESALDAHGGVLPPLQFAYSFLLDNPECFLPENPPVRRISLEGLTPSSVELACMLNGISDGPAIPQWPADMPQEPNMELIAAYYDSGASPTPNQGAQPGTGSQEKGEHQS